ncbi:mannitol dehydrogenase family protein [Glaciecola sp. XM2]|uniref:mannitol dehydrogenase family protein n=1 Tax=Glaciecola sp. XM2 TaxID=1914931 RepID=UPI001BDE639D|nr:mannitol dehydrogenase family protein [Glaciecola sp. XM2]MBT1450780.1 mannitol dehydrogenase family protein [Glaciecola sp. XM2]
MTTLNRSTLSTLGKQVSTPQYHSQDVSSGILHFGVGNFHRAHQAVYCDALLNLKDLQWGITGVSMRSPDVRDVLRKQDYYYTLALIDQNTEYRVIGALQRVLFAVEECGEILKQFAKQETQLITTTITEKGYCLAHGKLDLEHVSIKHDMASIQAPQSIYGYLAAGLIERFSACRSTENGQLTILCCDNISAGGEIIESGVKALLEIHNTDTLAWLNTNVSFISSMVDRVTPADSEAFTEQVKEVLGVEDNAAVSTEPFSQWVIEDNFAGKRPDFDKVGAVFSKDVGAFERVKLRFLNAAHTMLSILGYLADDEYIHQALQRKAFAQFTRDVLIEEVLPVTSVSSEINAHDYIDSIFARFANARLPYKVMQVGTDSSQKIQQRLFPSVDASLAQEQDTDGLAFILAAWVCFIRKALDQGDLNDVQKEQFNERLSSNKSFDLLHCLSIAQVHQCEFINDEIFIKKLIDFRAQIDKNGIFETINTLSTKEVELT